MKTIAPSYYNKFTCIADRCRQNCCIGWEIDIDEDTLKLYKNVSGSFGDKIRSGINMSDPPCFKLCEGDRCTFLNESGLCDIILNLGEDALCDICTDHPRFRNFFSDRTEIGLGLCCEEACRIILGQTEPMRLIISEDDGNDLPDPDESEFFTERQHIFNMLTDRTVPLEERFIRLCGEYGIADSETDFAEFYGNLERLDTAWETYIRKMHSVGSADDCAVWENLAVYLVYRHSGNYSLEECVAFAVHTVRLLCTVCSGMEIKEIFDVCRMWSSEIEYSEDNTCAVMDILTE